MKMGLPGQRSTLFERLSKGARPVGVANERRLERAHGVHAVDEARRPESMGRPTEIPTREID